MNLGITALAGPAPGAAPHEMAEHKGRGQPDSLCDALAENLSIGLSRFYLERFGAILHHNVDKALLIGGAARPAFGGGELLEPIEITLAGRATRRFRGVSVPVDELAVELSREWLGRHLRHIDPTRDVRIVPRLRETSPDLAALFLRRGAGGPPRDRRRREGARRAQRRADRAHRGVRLRRPARERPRRLFRKEGARALVAAAAGGEVALNAADGATPESVYLTVTGLAAEGGDDGQVGRGNRVNGLITPYRPMSLEAAAGKNPVSHTGKLYNLLAERIARKLAAGLPGVEEAYCSLLSRIGSPITEPQLADVRMRLADARALEALRPRASQIVHEHLAAAPQLWREVLAGRCPVL